MKDIFKDDDSYSAFDGGGMESNGGARSGEGSETELSPADIAVAKKKIAERHTLRDTPLEKVFSSTFCRSFSPQNLKSESPPEELDQQQKIIRMLAKETGQGGLDLNRKETEKDPYLQLGYGMVVYRHLLSSLITLFGILSIVAVVLMTIYAKGGTAIARSQPFVERLSLGNLGYDSVQCIVRPLVEQHVELDCPQGNITEVVPRGVGVNVKDLYQNGSHLSSFFLSRGPTEWDRNQCLQSDENPNSRNLSSPARVAFETLFDEKCRGKEKCRLAFNDLPPLLEDGHLQKIKNHSTFFLQFTCRADEATNEFKKHLLWYIAGAQLLIIVIFQWGLKRIQDNEHVQQQKYSINTTDISDYTVHMKIKEGDITEFLDQRGDPLGESESPALEFKKHLHHKIKANIEEFTTQRMEKLDREISEANPEYHIFNNILSQPKTFELTDEQKLALEIVDIQFCFDQRDILTLLEERAPLFNQKDVNEDCKKILVDKDEEIDRLIQKKFALPNHSLSMIKSAFVTFKTDFAQYQCTKMGCLEWQDPIKSKHVHITQAPEPLNIIWKNITEERSYFRTRFESWIGILLLLTCYYLVMLDRKRWCLRKIEKYPMNTACADFQSLSKARYAEELSEVGFYYSDPINNTGTVRPLRHSGRLVCFCEYQFQNRSLTEKLTKLGTYDRNFTFEFDGREVTRPICNSYYAAKQSFFWWTKATDLILIAMNQVILYTIQGIVSAITFPDYSTKEQMLAWWTFVAQFINLGVLPLVVDANFQEQSTFVGTFLYQFLFHENKSDFDQEWFQTSGYSIFFTMTINAFTTPIVALLMHFWSYKSRKWDQRRGEDTSECRTVQEYVNLHSGPDYPMYQKQTFIMLTVYMTMFHGLALPILYPIACLTLLVYYYTDILMLFYVYKQPDVYDEKLSQMMTRAIKRSLIAGSIMAIWHLSNRQLVKREGPAYELIPVQRLGDPFMANHNALAQFVPLSFAEDGEFSPDTILYFACCVLLIYVINFSDFSSKLGIVKGLLPRDPTGTDDKEQLRPYFENITRNHIQRTLKLNKVYKEVMNIESMPDNTLEQYQEMMEARQDQGIELAIKQAFHLADVDKDTAVSREELERVLAADGLDQAAIERIYQETDVDGDGEISYAEFFNAIKRRVLQEDGFQSLGVKYSYDILENPKYKELLGYNIDKYDHADGDGENNSLYSEKKNCDLITIALNLPYMSGELRKKFRFCKIEQDGLWWASTSQIVSQKHDTYRMLAEEIVQPSEKELMEEYHEEGSDYHSDLSDYKRELYEYGRMAHQPILTPYRRQEQRLVTGGSDKSRACCSSEWWSYKWLLTKQWLFFSVSRPSTQLIYDAILGGIAALLLNQFFSGYAKEECKCFFRDQLKSNANCLKDFEKSGDNDKVAQIRLDFEETLLEDYIKCPGYYMLMGYVIKPVFIWAVFLMYFLAIYRSRGKRGGSKFCGAIKVMTSQTLYTSKIFIVRVLYDVSAIIFVGLDQYEKNVQYNYQWKNFMVLAAPIAVLEVLLYFISVRMANFKADKFNCRLLEASIETERQHKDMFSTDESDQQDDDDELTLARESAQGGRRGAAVRPRRESGGKKSKQLREKLLEQYRREAGGYDPYQVCFEKRYKPVYISFVDLILVISAVFASVVYLWRNQPNKAEADYEPFYALVKRLLALDLCLAAKVVFNMAFLNLDRWESISKRMNKSSWTHLFFWCRFFLSMTLFQVVFEYYYEGKEQGSTQNIKFLAIITLYEFFVYMLCVAPANQRLSYQMNRKQNEWSKRRSRRGKHEAVYRRKRFEFEQDPKNRDQRSEPYYIHEKFF